MIKVGIVEDNHTLRNSLFQWINRTEDMQCILSLSHLHNLVSELKKSMPDILLMDIGLPEISGIEGVRTVKSNFPKVQVLMFTVFEDEEAIFSAIKAGASGYLLKKSSPEEIVTAICQLYEGGAPMTPAIARKVISAFQTTPSKLIDEAALTVREKEILYSLVDGLSYKKIADKYFVSISTIRTHICSIYQKLHVHSKSEAVAKVLQQK